MHLHTHLYPSLFLMDHFQIVSQPLPNSPMPSTMIPFICTPNLAHTTRTHVNISSQPTTNPTLPPLANYHTKQIHRLTFPSDPTKLCNHLRSLDVIWHYIFWLGIYVSSITGYWSLGVEVLLVLIGVWMSRGQSKNVHSRFEIQRVRVETMGWRRSGFSY